jgi:hypothetical protein
MIVWTCRFVQAFSLSENYRRRLIVRMPIYRAKCNNTYPRWEDMMRLGVCDGEEGRDVYETDRRNILYTSQVVEKYASELTKKALS